MTNANFSPIPSSLVTLALTGGAASISSGDIPGSARYAEGFVRTASVVETRDGTTPTSSLGTGDAGDIILLRSRYEITNFSAIKASSNATIDWQFYNRAPN